MCPKLALALTGFGGLSLLAFHWRTRTSPTSGAPLPEASLPGRRKLPTAGGRFGSTASEQTKAPQRAAFEAEEGLPPSPTRSLGALAASSTR